MKFIYILIAIVGMALASCQDFLIEEPTTQLTSEEIYNSASTANAALNGCYGVLASYDYYGYRFYYLTETTSGLFTSTRTPTADMAMASLEVSTNDVHNEKLFNAIYKAIGGANDILYYLNLPDNQLDPATRSRIKGEASLIRGLCYFNLVRLWGACSLVTQPATSYAETQVKRSSVVDVYKQIIQDMDSAYVWLPENGTQQAGRPHRYASKAMQAKIYATMATCDSIPSNLRAGYWDSAYVKAKEVVFSPDGSVRGAYKLLPLYTSLFTASNRNTAESILEIQMSVLAGGLKVTEATLPKSTILMPNAAVSTQSGKTRPNKEVYDLMNTTYPGDPRKDAAMLYNSYTTATNTVVKCYPTVTTSKDTEFPFLRKYADQNFTTSSACNFVVYRYADLLLTLAEAANETGRTSEAVTYVNWVLMRARDKNGDGIYAATETSPANWLSTISQVDFRSKIMDERIIELIGEGEDWFTTHRRKDYYVKTITRHNDRLNAISTDPTIQSGFSAKAIFFYPATEEKIKRNMLLPYPVNEINNNEAIPQTDQNYGY